MVPTHKTPAGLAVALLVIVACTGPVTDALQPSMVLKKDTSVIYYLDFWLSRVMAVNAETGGARAMVSGLANTGRYPDGIAVDDNYMYWGLMGNPETNDGQIRRSNLDGTGITTIIDGPSLELEGAFTPKQLTLNDGKLYWGDREGMRVMRSNLDGTSVETLVQAGVGPSAMKNQSKHCVGVAVDPTRRHVYWTQKGDEHGHGAIFRANLDIPAGEGPANRTDISMLFAKQPWPVDLELDLEDRMIYWTDGTAGTVNRASMDTAPACHSANGCGVTEMLLGGLGTPIGIVLNKQAREVCYATHSNPHVGCIMLDEPHLARLVVENVTPITGLAIKNIR